ncbi:MAG: hypothetical protein CVV45_12685, partial [Spirochaetae bacterium HGW-Spirochaetae-10]
EALLRFLNLARKDRQKEIRRLRDELRNMEKRMKELEAKRAELTQILSSGAYDQEKYKAMEEVSKTLADMEREWMELQEQIDLFEGEI